MIISDEERARQRRCLPKGLSALDIKQTALLKKIVSLCSQEIEKWGYSEIITPNFEHYECLITNLGKWGRAKTYGFLDDAGYMLMLKSDSTIPACRLAAESFSGFYYPLRIYYVSTNCRRMPGGGNSEKLQIGAELLNNENFIEDEVEIITLCVNLLDSLGIKDYKIKINNLKYTDILFKHMEITPELKFKIIGAVIEANTFNLKELLNNLNIENKKITDCLKLLPELYGGGDILKKADHAAPFKEMKEEVKKLKKITSLVLKHKKTEFLYDFTMRRMFDYYTDVVFEVYVKNNASAIAGGGRYGALLKKFGMDKTGIGFALYIDEIIKADTVFHKASKPDCLIITDDYLKGLKKAEKFRADGKTAEVLKNNFKTKKELKEYIAARKPAKTIEVK